MELKLYDTLTKEKRVFTPLDPKRVRMYVCGPTVYDFAHIGNARPVIVFDVLYRLLRHLAATGAWDDGKGETTVTYVRNITDVDDKINARAAEQHPNIPLNEAIRHVTEQTEKQFHEDVDALGCLRPTHEPRATEHISEMKDLIERLIKSKQAYVEHDHVLFSVPSMPEYGMLGKQTPDQMIEGARVEVAPIKHDAMDFVLWKPSKVGEPSWPSPAGINAPGRPGWHIECSAMAWKYLGETFDIHGGGIDLVFPHHENEIAQTRCAFHSKVMANFWMHNGFLQVEGEKMAKSAGNFITIRELRENWNGYPWPGEALRFNMLRTHYRHPIDWTFRNLDESHKILWDWYEKLEHVEPALVASASFLAALSDDLNTPEAITELHKLYRERKLPEMRAALNFLGLSGERPKLARHYVLRAETGRFYLDDQSQDAANQVVTIHHDQRRRQIAAIQSEMVEPPIVPPTKEEIEALVAARNEARKAKNFAESDRIRDELAAMGVVLKDSKDGTTWEIAR